MKDMNHAVFRFLDGAAYRAFLIWTTVAKQHIAGLEIPEMDGDAVTADFHDAVQGALTSAWKTYGHPVAVGAEPRFKEHVQGYVAGELGLVWSYRYLPPPPFLDYLLWLKAFVILGQLHGQTRAWANRLFVTLKQCHPTLGLNLSTAEAFPRDGDYAAHCAVSDLQADNNWINFMALFERYFAADVSCLTQQFCQIDFPKQATLLSDDQLDKLLQLDPTQVPPNADA